MYAKPHNRYEYHWDRLSKSKDDYDLRHILSLLKDRSETESTDYYQILEEFALLPRNSLRSIKKMFYFFLDSSRENKYPRPKRFHDLTSTCGFVFFALPKEEINSRREKLVSITLLAKYSLKCNIQIGVSIVYDGIEFIIDWSYIKKEYKYDEKLENELKKNQLFPDIKSRKVPRYFV